MATFLTLFVLLSSLNFGTLGSSRPGKIPRLSKSGKLALDAYVSQVEANGTIPGFVVAVSNIDEQLYAYAGGLKAYNDPSSGRVTTDSIFSIYSLTKLVTSIAGLQLVEQGKLRFDDPISKHLPELQEVAILSPNGSLTRSKKAPTVGQLFSHSTGLTYFSRPRKTLYEIPTGNTFPQVGSRRATLARFFEEVKNGYAATPLLFEPGTSFSYGYSTDIIGIIVEKLSGKSLAEYANENIFRKIGSQASYRLNAQTQSRVVEMHFRETDGSITRWANQTALPPRYPNPVGKPVANPVLSRQGVRSIFQRKLSTGGETPLREAVEALDPIMAGRDVTFSTALAILKDDIPGGPKAGSGFWYGFAGLWYLMDPTTGIALVAGTQIAPSLGPLPVEFFHGFERIVYENLE